MKKSIILTAVASTLFLSSGSLLAQINTKKYIKNKPIQEQEIISTVNNRGAKNALFMEGHSYHVNNDQPLPVSDSDITYKLTNTNTELFVSLNVIQGDKEVPLEYFNFKNLPGVQGQIHALWLRSDFSESINRTFDITGQNVDNLKISIPDKFQTQGSKQCDIVFLSYQLKNTESPANIIRFVKIEREDEKSIMKFYETMPSDCQVKAPDFKQNAFYSKSGYVVNFGFNPQKMNQENTLDFTLHASKEGKEHFLESVETVLIKSDFSSLNFIIPENPRFKKSPISAYYGINYSATVLEKGMYFIGLGFGNGTDREWLYSNTEIK